MLNDQLVFSEYFSPVIFEKFLPNCEVSKQKKKIQSRFFGFICVP